MAPAQLMTAPTHAEANDGAIYPVEIMDREPTILEACFRQDNGLVICLRPPGSPWSQLERGLIEDPRGGLFYSVCTVSTLWTWPEVQAYLPRYVYQVTDSLQPAYYYQYDRENPEHLKTIKEMEVLPWQF